MPVVALTDISIRNLKPIAGKRTTYLDKTLKGFGVRITEKAQMSYVLTYGPNRARVKLGDVGIIRLSEARARARTILAERTLGQFRPVGQETYQNALQGFLEASRAKNRTRTTKDYTRLLTRYGFGAERLGSISPKEAQRKLDQLAHAPSEQAHAHAALKIFFSYCVRRHLLDQNPMARVERPHRSESRSRVLTEDELRSVWHAAVGMFGSIVQLCILTGQRRSEISNLRAEMIEGDCIRFPASYTKNRREHLFPIGKMTQAILATLPNTGPLFPARKTWRAGGTTYNAWNKDKPALDKASGVTGWVLHDLRRTFVSSWAALGTRIEVTEKYVNHVSGTHSGIVGIYQRHTFMPEMRSAVDRWETYLYTLTAPLSG